MVTVRAWYLGHDIRKRVFGYMQTVEASAQSDQGPRCPLAEPLNTIWMYEWTVKARLRLCACAGWCELAHFAYARRHVFAWRDSYNWLLPFLYTPPHDSSGVLWYHVGCPYVRLSVCPSVRPYFPNLIWALILWSSDLGFLIGKFRQFLTVIWPWHDNGGELSFHLFFFFFFGI